MTARLNASFTGSATPGRANVTRTVVDDGGSRIDELRIRGQLKKVTVSPRGAAPGYEIIVPQGGSGVSEGAAPTRDAAGKRVWNVLRF